MSYDSEINKDYSYAEALEVLECLDSVISRELDKTRLKIIINVAKSMGIDPDILDVEGGKND